MYQNELQQMNEDLQKVEHHILMTQQENRRQQFIWEEKKQEIKEHQIRQDRENYLREQKAAKAAQMAAQEAARAEKEAALKAKEAALKAKNDKKAEKKKRKESAGASQQQQEENNNKSRSNSFNDDNVKEKKKSNQHGLFEEALSNGADIQEMGNNNQLQNEAKVRQASVASAQKAGSIEHLRESNHNEDGELQVQRSSSREFDNRSLKANPRSESMSMNGAPAIVIERRNSFEDHSQEIEIQDPNKINLKHSMQERPDDYYYDDR